ncbi:MAG TPA: hypothetical protein VFN35_33825 [Ktedonobacteraceae bacterium]|nr:hypothetical protein [Ktedonobacteraceae bacterium]
MRRHPYRNLRIIWIMLWAFPYLIWQGFGHFHGFFIWLLLALALLVILRSLFRTNNHQTIPALSQQPQTTIGEQQYYSSLEKDQWEALPYQRGYRADTEFDRASASPYQRGEHQPQYEDMLVQYPQEMPSQEMPPMEQS